jgi:hypothetical protein
MTARELDVDYADHRKNMQNGEQMVEFVDDHAFGVFRRTNYGNIISAHHKVLRPDPHRQP